VTKPRDGTGAAEGGRLLAARAPGPFGYGKAEGGPFLLDLLPLSALPLA